MNQDWFGGLAIGIGVGYLNATALGIPGWANILLMGLLMVFASVGREVI